MDFSFRLPECLSRSTSVPRKTLATPSRVEKAGRVRETLFDQPGDRPRKAAKKSTAQTPTTREEILFNNNRDLTPLHDPLFPFDKVSLRRPEQYLLPYSNAIPCGPKIAEWMKDFFCLAQQPNHRKVGYCSPIRPNAPTNISLFFYDASSKRSLDTYLRRLQNLADMGEQAIIYVPPELTQKLQAMRKDMYWCVVDDYETIWDFPNNRYQYYNFTTTQPSIFFDFETGMASFQLAYNRPFLSAASNAKAFCTFDAVMRNPFGSDSWLWVDAGLFDEGGPTDANGVTWGDLKFREHLDERKIDRSIGLSKDTGIVLGEHPGRAALTMKDVNDPCWTDPKKAWQAHRFAAGLYVGSSLGMLNYSVRFMQTVDDLDANGRYSGREEYVIAFLAARYPNTIFSIPFQQPVTPKPVGSTRSLMNYPFKTCFTTQGGPETVPLIVDPLSTLYCKQYVPRQPNLLAAGTPDYTRDAMYQ